MTTREKMIVAASRRDGIGDFINTDGQWCVSTSPELFKAHIESYGFKVIDCRETANSTAIAKTADGYKFAYNGHCSLVK